MKKYSWAITTALLMVLSLTLRYAAGIHYPAYAIGAVAAGIVLWHYRSNLTALVLILVSSGLFLRFVLRGYAWWGYTFIFIAGLLLLHAYLPVTLWRIVVALTCIGLAWFCFVEYFVIKNARTDRDPGRDYLIVLGAQVRETGPSVVLQYRLDEAAAYLEENPDTCCIVSGGQGANEPFPEAEGMRRYLEEKGIAPEGVMELTFRLDINNRPHQIWDSVYGKKAVTEWKIECVQDYHAPDGSRRPATRVLFRPHTGRTHQLRLASADPHGFGVPIIGDTLYGSCAEGERLMLHASRLCFTHPMTGRRMEFTSPAPF